MSTSFLISIVLVELISLALLPDILKLKIKPIYKFGLCIFILVPLIGLGFYLLIRPYLGFELDQGLSHTGPRGYYPPKDAMKLQLETLKRRVAEKEHSSKPSKLGSNSEKNV